MGRRPILALVLITCIGAASADTSDLHAVRQEVADALADPSAAFERYLMARLGEANATVARALARGGSSSSSAAADAPTSAVAAAAVPTLSAAAAAATTTSPAAPALSPEAAAEAARTLPPNLRVLVPAMTSGAERARRRAIFRASLREAAALNDAALRKAGGNAAEAPAYGLTEFAHLSGEEWRRMYVSKPFSQLKNRVDMRDADAETDPDAANPGDTPGAGAGAGENTRRRRRARALRRRLSQTATTNPPLQCKKQIRTSPFSRVNPPAALDWRNMGGTSYVTPIRNQLACGSCASFSTVVTLEAVAILRTLARRAGGTANAGTTASSATDLAEQDFLNCWDTKTDECGGALPSWYYDRAVCQGIASEADVPYKAVDANKCAQVIRDTLGLKGWFEPPATDKGVKQALTKAPVSIAILVDDSFRLYRGGVLPCGTKDGSKGVNHAVGVVGYDATSYIVKNSWGPGWGENGYVRLASGCARGNSALNMLTPGFNVGANF